MYALNTPLEPKAKAAAGGCPATGWVHEDRPPWRVIVSDSPANLPLVAQSRVIEYDGDEDTISWDQYTAEIMTRRDDGLKSWRYRRP